MRGNCVCKRGSGTCSPASSRWGCFCPARNPISLAHGLQCLCANKRGLGWLQGSFRQTSASFMFGLPRHFHPFHDLDLIKWLTFKYFSTNLPIHPLRLRALNGVSNISSNSGPSFNPLSLSIGSPTFPSSKGHRDGRRHRRLAKLDDADAVRRKETNSAGQPTA